VPIDLRSQPMNLASGEHVCQFYRDADEMVRAAAAFIEEGLRTGERCLWVLPPWLELSRARAAARIARGNFDDPESTGRLIYLTPEDVCYDDRGRIRSADAVLQFWLGQEREALARGFRGIRITGDGTAVDCARRTGSSFTGHRVTALCTCCLPVSDGSWSEAQPGSGRAAAEPLQRAS
jgi:hypothetical protein